MGVYFAANARDLTSRCNVPATEHAESITYHNAQDMEILEIEVIIIVIAKPLMEDAMEMNL